MVHSDVTPAYDDAVEVTTGFNLDLISNKAAYFYSRAFGRV
jgi:hypothetical protein